MKENGFQVLVDSGAFMDDMEMRILKAKDRVMIQAMTFEMDKAGMRLISAMKKSKAKEKVLCVDSYSLVNINDGWAYAARYFTSKKHRDEVKATRKILTLRDSDIHVVLTNPVGFLGMKYPFRNHKKMMIVDNVAYLGGINFSDHNFSWHDFMVRISDDEVVGSLVHDFRLTIQKKNQSAIQHLTTGRIYFLNGSNSGVEYELLFDEILKAKKSISILSPYVSDPLLSRLKKLNPQVTVNIFTPRQNNKSLMKNGLYDAIRHTNFNLYEYRGMSHLKAILVDDSKLLFGSSNFDIVSYYLEQEVVMVSEDEHLVTSFRDQILVPDRSQSELIDLSSLKRNVTSRIVLILLKKIIAILAKLFSVKNDPKD